jgi:hemerythrin
MPIRVQWDSNFSVGNDLLDRQHRTLLGLCNDMAECLKAGEGEWRLRFHDILHQLNQYARDHFKAEEDLLQRHQYSEMDAQLAEHYAYVEQMTEWTFAASMNSIDMLGVQHYLAVWWRDHILLSDMQYKGLISSRERLQRPSR